MMVIPIVVSALGKGVCGRFGKGVGGRDENWRTNRNHPDYNIDEIGQNTEKSPGDLRSIVDTQTPLKDYQRTLVWKKSQGIW